MNSHEEYEFTQCSSDCMNSHVPLCVFVPDMELDCLTDSHIKLNSLDDMHVSVIAIIRKLLIMTKTP